MLYRVVIAVCSEIRTKHKNAWCWQNVDFLGAFVMWRKVTLSFVLSVCPFVCLEQLGFHWTGFHEVLNVSIFRKSVEKVQVCVTSVKSNGYFTLRTMNFHDNTSLKFFRIGNISDKCCGNTLFFPTGGTRWRIRLRHCATSRKVAGSMPMVSLQFFSDIILPTALWPWGRLIL